MKIKAPMITDYYELTMAQSYFNANMQNKVAVFDVFFRKNPFNGGYGLMGGVDEIVELMKYFRFDEEDINYLRSKNKYSEDFLNYLKNFKFSGSIYAIPDGTPVFKGEPIITVEAPIIEAQIMETILLIYANSNICFTTAARKVVESANPIPIAEFGARRSLGESASITASKCAYIAGCASTSNVEAGRIYNIPVSGTMAHSFVEFFPTEYEAFLNYAKTYPNDCTLLVDTYDVLKSGIPNAIKVAQEYLIPNGYRLKGIRIDSGDLAYLTKQAKKMLSAAGLDDVSICVSNGLNEETIASLKNQGAVIDSIGLGDNIVLPDYARVGCVYKLVAVKDKEKYIPRIKVSDDLSKATTPGYKKVYRLYDKNTNYALADLIALYDEKIPEDKIILVDPNNENNQTILTNYTVRELQVPIIINGQQIYKTPSIDERRKYCQNEANTLYPEIKRSLNPHNYYIDLTRKLLLLKKELIKEAKSKTEPTLRRK